MLPPLGITDYNSGLGYLALHSVYNLSQFSKSKKESSGQDMSATQTSPAHQDCHSSSKWNQKRHCYFLFLLIVVIAAFTHNLSASQASEQDYSAQDYQKAQQSYEKAAADGNAE